MKNFFLLLLVIGLIGCKSNTSTKSPEISKRFFSDSSFWNQPISKNAKIDPRTRYWVSLLEKEPTGENFGVSYRQWTIPVYEVDSTTPVYQIKNHYLSDEEKRSWHVQKDSFGHGPGFDFVPIPDGATPDAQSDAHIVLVDWHRMLAWDMWGLRKTTTGDWESNTGMVYPLDGPGVFDGDALGAVDGESIHFHGPSRAAGVPAMAGLIMYDEVMSGKIAHKLSCATRYAAFKEFVYPACWTDGYTKGGIPEGAVIQLDPDLDLTPFHLTPEEAVIAKALQEYGMVVVDVAQGQPIYAEGLWGHPGKSWEGKVREWDGGINSIPYDHYRVLLVENAVFKGDGRSMYNTYWE